MINKQKDLNYWQFKFNKPDIGFKELKGLKEGDIFFTEITENHVLKEVGTNTIVFWDRTDKEKGIHLVTRIMGEPYESDEVSSGKAVPVKVIKKFDKPFILEDNGFKILHNKLNTLKYKGRVRARASIDEQEGSKLLNKILPNYNDIKTNLEEINEEQLKNTLALFLNDYNQYIEDGKNGYYYNVFMEANIASQEIRHSSFLANLLKSDGNHFQGNLFLKHFLEEIKLCDTLKNCEAINNFDVDNYTVATEEFNDDKEQKGLIDIIIKDQNYAIIIENKTGTKDHNGQLLKYKDFVENIEQYKHLKDYIILYLTPKGEEPTDENARNDSKIISISYK